VFRAFFPMAPRPRSSSTDENRRWFVLPQDGGTPSTPNERPAPARPRPSTPYWRMCTVCSSHVHCISPPG
jgi:hypothetical protein